jgi:hypothetical protein
MPKNVTRLLVRFQLCLLSRKVERANALLNWLKISNSWTRAAPGDLLRISKLKKEIPTSLRVRFRVTSKSVISQVRKLICQWALKNWRVFKSTCNNPLTLFEDRAFSKSSLSRNHPNKKVSQPWLTWQNKKSWARFRSLIIPVKRTSWS